MLSFVSSLNNNLAVRLKYIFAHFEHVAETPETAIHDVHWFLINSLILIKWVSLYLVFFRKKSNKKRPIIDQQTRGATRGGGGRARALP